MSDTKKKHPLARRFRGYYPIVVDVETGGLDFEKSALLDIAAYSLTFDENNQLVIEDEFSIAVLPDEKCEVSEDALKINKINLEEHALKAVNEHRAVQKLFQFVRKAIKRHNCQRGILVGHNATFDLSFINAAAKRQGLKRNPFHPFSVMDTVGLAGFAYGQTVLKVAAQKAGLSFDDKLAHTAQYDAKVTADLFCKIYNEFQWQY